LLLVDDDPDIHDLVACLLECQDIEILSALNGKQALEIARRESPDLILLDYALPGSNGIEVMLNLRTEGVPESIPIIFITAKVSNAVLTACFQAGAIDYIRKPFCAAELRARVRSVRDRTRMLSQLEQLALCDSLTNLPNRLSIRNKIQFAIEHSDSINYAVLFLDFDRFKLVNDTLGHDVGDLLLKQIADRLRDSLRSSDTVTRVSKRMVAARLGGDEFVVLLEDLADPKDAMVVAERLLVKLADPYRVAGHEVSSTASIGVVNNLKRYSTTDDVLRDADTAMYAAKSAGAGQCVLYEQSMVCETQQRAKSRKTLHREASVSETSH
jgi:diguanylate cyclase (GGDEF)-like protein